MHANRMLQWYEESSVKQAKVAPLSAVMQHRGKEEWGEPAAFGRRERNVCLTLRESYNVCAILVAKVWQSMLIMY